MIFNLLLYIGLRAEASNFFIFLLTLILTSTAASGVAFFFSALVNVFALANILTTFTYVIMMVCVHMLTVFLYHNNVTIFTKTSHVRTKTHFIAQDHGTVSLLANANWSAFLEALH